MTEERAARKQKRLVKRALRKKLRGERRDKRKRQREHNKARRASYTIPGKDVLGGGRAVPWSALLANRPNIARKK